MLNEFCMGQRNAPSPHGVEYQTLEQTPNIKKNAREHLMFAPLGVVIGLPINEGEIGLLRYLKPYHQ